MLVKRQLTERKISMNYHTFNYVNTDRIEAIAITTDTLIDYLAHNQYNQNLIQAVNTPENHIAKVMLIIKAHKYQYNNELAILPSTAVNRLSEYGLTMQHNPQLKAWLELFTNNDHGATKPKIITNKTLFRKPLDLLDIAKFTRDTHN